ncbi:MAG: putative nucleotide-diphospho-sugar transferase, partial [Parachlamydiaceae bacterium]
LEAIEAHWGNQIFFYSDIDIIFLKPVLEVALTHLGDNDFVVQQGWPQNALCAGFFVMRGNEKTLKLITTALRLLQKKECIDDQVALQMALKSFGPEEIAWKFLPSEQFPNGRRVLKNSNGMTRQIASTDFEIALDDSIVLFHANCVVGLDKKYQFLKRVQEEYFKKDNGIGFDSL